jgi:SAM-dependent methyltransferase
MLLCPDCRHELDVAKPTCGLCGWTFCHHDHVWCMLSSRDATSSQFREYKDIYDTLAERNARTPSLSQRYIEILADQFVTAIGSVAGANVCDVGAGRGAFIARAQRDGASSLTAVDVAIESLTAIQRSFGVRAIQANAENLPFQEEFDVLSATDILEHVVNVANFMITANWSLRPGGLLAIRVPHRENLKYYSRFFGLPFPFAHLRTFNRQLLKDTIEHYGFKVLRMSLNGFEHTRLHDFWQGSAIGRQLSSVIRNQFATDADVARVNPQLGRLFMKPIEITAIAVKTEDVATANAYSSFFDYKKADKG